MTVRKVFMASLVFVSIGACAQDVKSMIVKSLSDSQQTVELSNISSIKYENGMMVISMKNADVVKVSVADIKSMTFGSVSTAISSLTDKADVPFEIFDTKGKKLYSGVTGADGKVDVKINLNGIYVIKVGDKSKTVFMTQKQ